MRELGRTSSANASSDGGFGLCSALVWFFAAVCATFSLSMLALKVFSAIIKVDAPQTAAAKIGFWLPLSLLLKPEPTENATFAFTVCAAAILVAAGAWASARRRVNQAKNLPIWLAALLGVVICIAWIVRMDWSTILSPSPSFLVSSPIGKPWAFIFSGLLAAGVAAVLTRGVWRIPVVILAALPLIFMIRMVILAPGDGYAQGTHFEVFSYPIFQDWLGSGIYMGRDGQKSQYGMYPAFLWPIWKLFGGVSITAISVVMAALFFGSQVALVGFMTRFTRRPILGGVFAIAGVLVSLLLYPFWPGDAYFEFFPVRWVFPGLAFILLIWRVSRERFQFLSYLLLAPGLLWNFESGVVALGIYASFTIAAAFEPSWRAFATLCLRHFAMICAAVAVAVGGLELEYFARFGAPFDLFGLIQSILAFSSGAGAEPMPPFGAWGLHGLIYMAAGFVGLRGLWRASGQDDRYRAAALLATAVAGVLWLRYYQGRSLPLPLCFVSAPAVCCLGLMVDQAADRSRFANWAAAAVAVVMAGLFLGGFGAWVASRPVPNRSAASLLDRKAQTTNGVISNIVDKFEAVRTSPSDRLLVIAPYANQIDMALGHASPIKAAGMCQIWFQSEIDQAVAAARRPETKMAVLDASNPGCNILGVTDASLAAALRANYVEQPAPPGCSVAAAPMGAHVFLRKGLAIAQRPRADLALGRPASEISTFGDAAASRAVDGDVCGDYSHGSVAHTALGPAPWWQVDLTKSRAIDSIEIWNRSDCCSDRLDRFWVFVSDRPFLPTDTPRTLKKRKDIWGARVDGAPAPDVTIKVGRSGRFVRVQLDTSDWLALAEVKVFGN